MDCTIYVVETKALISCTVPAQLICAFVIAYEKSRFPHGAAHMAIMLEQILQVFCDNYEIIFYLRNIFTMINVRLTLNNVTLVRTVICPSIYT